MKNNLILLFFVLFSLPAGAQQVLTPEEAIRIGLENNFSIRIARNNAEISYNNKTLGTSVFLPRLDAAGGWNYTDSETETNSQFSFGSSTTTALSSSISLSWTLFDGFKMFADRARYLALANAGESQARLIIENTVVGILKSYFNLVQQEQLLAVSENSLKISKDRFERNRVKRDLGSVSSTEFLNAQVSYNSDMARFYDQQLRTEIARKDLNQLLARRVDESVVVSGDITLPSDSRSESDLLAIAMKQDAALLSAKNNLRVAEADVSAQTSTWFPRLTFNAGYGYRDSETDAGSVPVPVTTTSKDATVGLNLSFNLFNGWQDQLNRQNAEIRLRNQELSVKEAEIRLEGLINERLSTYRKQVLLVDLNQQSVDAARQNLAVQQDRFTIGAVNTLEFRDAQNALVQAETNLISSKYLARIAWLEIQQLIGEIAIR